MDDAEKLIGIVQTLLAKTEAGLVSWKEGGEDEYFATVSTGSVMVGLEQTQGFMSSLVPSYLVVRVLNKRGSLITSAKADRAMGSLPQAEWHAIVSNLYQTARREALMVDAVLDGVLDDIEAIGEDRPNETPS
jgi:hypothetical protein